MIIGVDHGYTYTKNSKGKIFTSRVREGETLDINSVQKVEMDGRNFVVGERLGDFTVDVNKVDDIKTKVSILTSIALSINRQGEEVKIITGLPPEHYSSQKEQLKDMLLENKVNQLIINGQERYFRIVDADVFVQGAGPVFLNPSKYKNGEVLVIDIGGLTVDVCYFSNMKLERFRTYEKGMLKLYSLLTSEANSNLGLRLNVSDGEKVLREGIKIYGQQQDLTFLNRTINSYAGDLITNIKLDFPIETMDHILGIGGGIQGLPIEDYIPNIEILNNGQFTNAKSYEEIGKVRFHG